ncbi:SAF domain-containing protein [Paenibacillus eucommiae]|uniref:SAF domain-containing protein n=1 Tax=Paenibacillus eucommiae TaxID=1355755 RepID=A0ABS4ITJ9_9BACL|nr:SAF domain-containing protein [Paenibacillus eucommiae]MBP1990906.1 hypothetical protein [Paenibacillus eucommiae]
MNRRRSLVISFTAAMLSGLLVYGVYILQVKQIALQQTIQVVVPKDFIRAGTLIQEQLVELRPVLKGSYNENMVSDLKEIIGQETLTPLGTNEPILKWKINRFHLLPGGDQSTFQIPKEYILSVSNGIRAGDQVRIYASAEGESHKLLDKDIMVASVKSSANIEVDNPKNSNLLSKANGDAEKMYLSRLEANGAIDQINLNLTEDEWLLLDRLCSTKKTKLVIAFSSASITKSN